MRILINDLPGEVERYRQIFRIDNYEDNQLIFIEGLSAFKEFVATQLEANQYSIDAIITSDSAYANLRDSLQASQLLFFKNSLVTSYSNHSLRIAAIPVILYSASVGIRRRSNKGSFDAMVEKNTVGNHDRLVAEVERVVRNWRRQLVEDLGVLGLIGKSLINFRGTQYYKNVYKQRFASHAEVHFAQHTKIVSLEFIRHPQPLTADWHRLTSSIIEQQLERYFWGLVNPKPYGGKWTENTVDHALLMENSIILTRGNYKSYLHEKSLMEEGDESERCDFIMLTDFPDLLPTGFLEVKKKDVKYFKYKKMKHKKFTSDLHDFLWQVIGYKEYAENPQHADRITEGIGYATTRFNYSLLAGRSHEKFEFIDLLNKRMDAQYPGIELLCYEDLGILAESYLSRFNRLFIGAPPLSLS